jgi:hypothetical protein
MLSVTSYVMYAGRNLPITIDDPVNTEQVNELPEPGSIIIRPEPGSPEIKESEFNDALAGRRLPSKPSKGDTTLGERYEEYSHSDYTHKYYTITKYQAGPVINAKSYQSIPKGSEITKSFKFDVSASIQYGAEANGTIKKLINLALKSSLSGSINLAYNFTETCKGPSEESAYNSRIYYSATHHDDAKEYAECTDYYDTYDYNNGRRILVERNSYQKTYTKCVSTFKIPVKYRFSKLAY